MRKIPSVERMSYSYLYLKKSLLKEKKFIEWIKTILAILIFLLSVVTYGYFVNISSTRGYFIKVEREKLSEVKFKKEIVSIDVRKIESQIFEKIRLDNYSNLTWKVLTIIDLRSVAMR